MAARTRYHKPRGLTLRMFAVYLTVLWASSLQATLNGNQGISRAVFLSGGSRGQFVALLIQIVGRARFLQLWDEASVSLLALKRSRSQLLEAECDPWLGAPSSKPAAEGPAPRMSHSLDSSITASQADSSACLLHFHPPWWSLSPPGTQHPLPVLSSVA